jgi:hypothetical protein
MKEYVASKHQERSTSLLGDSITGSKVLSACEYAVEMNVTAPLRMSWLHYWISKTVFGVEVRNGLILILCGPATLHLALSQSG